MMLVMICLVSCAAGLVANILFRRRFGAAGVIAVALANPVLTYALGQMTENPQDGLAALVTLYIMTVPVWIGQGLDLAWVGGRKIFATLRRSPRA